ncbi:transcription repressor OFP14-like [Phragmites australis]|uniref:transcription repressor OFP14-like n=1 Tax=Phragmites australis TaxID=29695 RepID=UPI002D76E796|nr:transcription repressor OFP14-like [Phragmites australis]
MEEEGVKAKNNKAVRSKKHARLHRSFLHFSKALKKLHGRGHADANGEPSSSSSSATSFLSQCMHPRTHSFASSRRHSHVAAARHKHDEDDDGDALAVNFRSLRVVADEGGSSSAQDYYSDGGSDEAEGVPPPAKVVVAGGGVAVVTFSAAPYQDFRRSMREMVDAARSDAAGSGAATCAPAVMVDWDLMEELLFCYLRLNDRAVHKDILRAFTDTVATLRRRRRAAARTPKTRRARRKQQMRASEEGRDVTDEAVASS